jgi:hypothetical protein
MRAAAPAHPTPFERNNTWITQALARFAAEYPQISLAMEVTNRWIDVSEEPLPRRIRAFIDQMAQAIQAAPPGG